MARVISVFWSICCKSELVSVTYDDVLCLALARVLPSLHHVTHKASHDACPGRTACCCVMEKEINKTKNTWAVTQFPHWRVDVWVLFLVFFFFGLFFQLKAEFVPIQQCCIKLWLDQLMGEESESAWVFIQIQNMSVHLCVRKPVQSLISPHVFIAMNFSRTCTVTMFSTLGNS